MHKCHSIIITGKVQDIGFRSIVEHIGRSFGLPGFVFNSKDGSVNILCSGEDTVIDNFKQEIKSRGAANGAEIAGIKEQTLSININLPEYFTKASADDDIDIGRKLDKANLLLKAGFNNLNTGLNDIKIGINNMTTIMLEQNKRMMENSQDQKEHNARLEAILEKLASK
ncbi:MAG: acylphosphatase [Candidatus Methanoperedens sp.]